MSGALMNDDLRQWSNGSGRVKAKKHPFTIDLAPGEFEDVRPNPRTAMWKKELAKNPKPKYTRGDSVIAGFVFGCILTIVVIFAYLYLHWR